MTVLKRCFVFLLAGKKSLKERSAATKDDKQTKLPQWVGGHVTDIKNETKNTCCDAVAASG